MAGTWFENSFRRSLFFSGLPFSDLNPTLARYQNPREADAMTKIQADLDETKIILVGIGWEK